MITLDVKKFSRNFYLKNQLLSIFLGLVGHIVSSNVELKYYEGESLLVAGTESLTGSYVDFDAYPHWCLG